MQAESGNSTNTLLSSVLKLSSTLRLWDVTPIEFRMSPPPKERTIWLRRNDNTDGAARWDRRDEMDVVVDPGYWFAVTCTSREIRDHVHELTFRDLDPEVAHDIYEWYRSELPFDFRCADHSLGSADGNVGEKTVTVTAFHQDDGDDCSSCTLMIRIHNWKREWRVFGTQGELLAVFRDNRVQDQ